MNEKTIRIGRAVGDALGLALCAIAVVVTLYVLAGCKKRGGFPGDTERWDGLDPKTVACSWASECDATRYQCGGASSTGTCVGDRRAYLCVKSSRYDVDGNFVEWRINCAPAGGPTSAEKVP